MHNNLLMRASTLVPVGIHQRLLEMGGRDLSAGGNCRIVMNCTMCLTIKRSLSTSRLKQDREHSELPISRGKGVVVTRDFYLTLHWVHTQSGAQEGFFPIHTNMSK